MKRYPAILGLLAAALLATPASAQRPTGRTIIGYRDGTLALVDAGKMRTMAQNSAIAYTEPEREMHAFGVNDPYLPKQWGLVGPFGIRWAGDVHGGTGVTVAVVDTGIRRDAPDLLGTSMVPGYDFVNNDADATDDAGHGTHVSGTIAQTTDNGYGCAGVAPGATLLPVKVLDASGSGSNYTVALGVRYAADHGASVINLSLGGAASRSVHDAITYAVGKGVTVCAAAGNSGAGSLSYPARYPECISVGAVDSRGYRAPFSQYGPGLSLVAPGVGILQQTFDPQTNRFYFGSWSGTSMATPFVTGCVALLKERAPALNPAAVKARLVATARKLGNPLYFGAGEVDATAALAGLGNPLPAPAPDPVPVPQTPDETVAAQVLTLVNQARATAGLPGLALEARLNTAAQGWAAWQADHNSMTHVAPDGTGPGERIAATGYRARTWGENVAYGYLTPAAVMQAWMASPGHKANILNAAFTQLGVGKALAADGTPYWTQDFSTQ